MKYKIIYLLLLFICVLCGCSEPADESSSEIPFNTDSEVSTVSNKIEDVVSYEVESQDVFIEEIVSVIEKEKNIEVSNTESIKPKEETPKQSEPATSDSTSKETASQISDTETDNINTEIESTVTSSEPIRVTEPKANKSDEKVIAAKMVEYINKYRNEQEKSLAVVLPGLTEYAEYRSRQLVLNFAHNTLDERAAATALKYGEYIDPQSFGSTGEPYYRANAREAILMAGYVDTVDVVAEKLALLVKNSSGHWNYVGGEEYKYIAIGVTYQNGMWYSDIAVSTVSHEN